MGRINAYLVAGGKWHDFDFARLELLKLLAEDEDVRVRVGADFADIEAISSADLLVTYTCDVRPALDQQRALHNWVAQGHRWLALHGTNSALDFTPAGVASPRAFPLFAETLGSQFISHPPIAPYRVTVSDPSNPLVSGIVPFETDDELYLSEMHGDYHILLETRWTGEAQGFVESAWLIDEPRPVAYLHPVGAGEVYYITLGHCRGKYDMQPRIDVYPHVERGSWTQPAYYELLRRGLIWAKRR